MRESPENIELFNRGQEERVSRIVKVAATYRLHVWEAIEFLNNEEEITLIDLEREHEDHLSP